MTRSALAKSHVGLVLVVASVAFCGPGTRGDEPDRARVEAEARGQAAEADRLFKAGAFAAALPLYEAERASRRALGDLRYEAYATRALGCCHERLGDLDAAIVAWRAARMLDAKRDDRGFEGYDWLLIGQARLRQQRPRDAVEALGEALPLLSKSVDRDHEIDARLLMAHALTVLEATGDVGAHLDRALTLARELKDLTREAHVLAGLARAAVAENDLGPAEEWLIDASRMYRDQALAQEAAAMDRLLGDVLLDLDCPEAARARVERAADAHGRLDDPASLADDLRFLTALELDAGEFASAGDLARRAADASREADDPEGEIEAHVIGAHAQSLAGDWAAAAKSLDAALRLARDSAEPAEHVRLLILAAEVAHRSQRIERRASLLDEAQTVAQESKNSILLRRVLETRMRQTAESETAEPPPR